MTDKTSTAPRELSNPALIFYLCLASLVGPLFGLIALAIRMAKVGYGAQAALGCGMAALASSAVGGVMGFVFGHPRESDSIDAGGDGADDNDGVEDDVRRSGGASRKPRFAANGSMQQIADWLPKLIIGAGLVGLKDLTGWLGRVGGSIGASLAIDADAGRVIGASAVVYFAAIGFLAVYVHTRTIIAVMLARSADAIAAAEKAVQAATQRVAQGVSDAVAQTVTREARSALHAVSESVGQTVTTAAVHAARDIRTQFEQERKLQELLYRPDGAQQAIELAERERAEGTLTPWGELLLACAYGQRNRDQTKAGASADVVRAARDGAYSALQRALAGDPSLRAYARDLLLVDSSDDDLRPFRDDEAFLALVA
jgi:hypothetical protein